MNIAATSNKYGNALTAGKNQGEAAITAGASSLASGANQASMNANASDALQGGLTMASAGASDFAAQMANNIALQSQNALISMQADMAMSKIHVAEKMVEAQAKQQNQAADAIKDLV